MHHTIPPTHIYMHTHTDEHRNTHNVVVWLINIELKLKREKKICVLIGFSIFLFALSYFRFSRQPTYMI